MNILDANKIKKNPNIIDEMEDSKLTDEIVGYAIKNGYKMNRATLARLARFPAYVSHFKNTEEMLSYQIKLAKQNEGLSVLFAFCESDKDRFTNIIIRDNDLIKIAIYKDYLHMLGESNIIKIVKARPQFLDDVLSKYQDPKEEFRRFIVSFQNPIDLFNLNVLEKYEETFLLESNAGKITELLVIFKQFGKHDKLEKYSQLLVNQIENNIPGFLWYMNLIDRIYEYDFLKNNPSIEEKTMQYLKENHIMFSYNLPEFVLQDEEYIMQCIRDNPKIVPTLPIYFAQNLDVIIECLKSDYMSFSDNRHTFTIEEYARIYNETKDYIQIEDVLKNNFLLQNPYYIKELINQGIKIEDYKIRDSAYYDEQYEEIKKIADERGISIPKPYDYYQMVEQEDGKIVVVANSIERIKRGLEYIEEKGILGSLTVRLRQGNFDEFLITDNLEFFKKLLDDNININFQYNTGKGLFRLSKIIEDEENMNMVAEELKKYNFSPLEQVIAVFDIVKNFKKYNLSNEKGDAAASRSFFEYLNNNYMVCAGYSDLFVNLGHRLNAQYAYIGLNINDHKRDTIIAHARNYANIVDYKYGVDGVYALETTWEQSRASSKSRFEEIKNTYHGLMLTTDEGREYSYPDSEIILDYDGIDGIYDTWLTMDNAEKLRQYLIDPETNQEDPWKCKEIKKFVKQVSPELYKEISARSLSDYENCEILVNYFKSKVNKKIPRDKILDAVMEVKKKIYVNLTEQDIEDMKMAYSITDPFRIYDENDGKYKSAYGEETFNNYLLRRFEDFKTMTVDEAINKNHFINIKRYLWKVIDLNLRDEGIFADPIGFGKYYVDDKEYVECILNHLEEIKNIGLKVEVNPEGSGVRILISDKSKEDTIEKMFNDLQSMKSNLYGIITRQKNTEEDGSR